ncbi:hypothetical protein [Gordonia polyisoprenivorans]|uniref:hypothetical protein n=1 Tax=Gordonia polyisoprenivorans TaxID=84595 RepID=UPI0030CF4332
MNNDPAVIAATQTLLDQAADRAWNRMIDAQGTPLHSMCRDIAFAAKDRADTYRHTHRAPINPAIEALNTAAWQAHDIEPNKPQAGHLRAWLEQFEDDTNSLAPDLKVIACAVLRALSMLTGVSTVDVLDSLPAVAAWIGGQS